MPESGGRETWGPRKLTAPSHGHPFPLSMGSNWQFTGLPGSGPSSLSYLGPLGGGGQGAVLTGGSAPDLARSSAAISVAALETDMGR